MARIVLLQMAAALITALIAAVIAGLPAGLSALCGGLCCALPNAFFAVRLYASTKKPGGAGPMSFFVGEFIKIAATIALMLAVVRLYHDLHWVAFIAGIVVVLKSYFILLFRYKL
jgi:ATP synthase protein I